MVRVYETTTVTVYPCFSVESDYYGFSWVEHEEGNYQPDWHWEDMIGCCVVMPDLMDTPHHSVFDARAAVCWVGF